MYLQTAKIWEVFASLHKGANMWIVLTRWKKSAGSGARMYHWTGICRIVLPIRACRARRVRARSPAAFRQSPAGTTASWTNPWARPICATHHQRPPGSVFSRVERRTWERCEGGSLLPLLLFFSSLLFLDSLAPSVYPGCAVPAVKHLADVLQAVARSTCIVQAVSPVRRIWITKLKLWNPALYMYGWRRRRGDWVGCLIRLD